MLTHLLSHSRTAGRAFKEWRFYKFCNYLKIAKAREKKRDVFGRMKETSISRTNNIFVLTRLCACVCVRACLTVKGNFLNRMKRVKSPERFIIARNVCFHVCLYMCCLRSCMRGLLSLFSLPSYSDSLCWCVHACVRVYACVCVCVRVWNVEMYEMFFFRFFFGNVASHVEEAKYKKNCEKIVIQRKYYFPSSTFVDSIFKN